MSSCESCCSITGLHICDDCIEKMAKSDLFKFTPSETLQIEIDRQERLKKIQEEREFKRIIDETLREVSNEFR